MIKSLNRYLLEADDDNQGGGTDAGSNANSNDSSNADSSTDTSDDAATNDNETNGEDTSDGDADAPADDDEFDIDDGGGDSDADGEDSGDDAGDDVEGGDESLEGDSSVDGEVEKPELDDMYKDLSPTQIAARDYILKDNFTQLYKTASGLISNTMAFPNTSETKDQLNALIKSLMSFKEFIVYYIKNIYSTKTYNENEIEFYKYLSIFNGYKSIYIELEKVFNHHDD